MSVLESLAFDEICVRRSIRARDVTLLRGLFLDQHFRSAEDIEGLLTINRTCGVQDESWSDFLSDAIADYVVRDEGPAGYITAANAAWLTQALAPDGQIEFANLLRVLPKAMMHARWAPTSLTLFAFKQVEYAVSSGRGPLRLTNSGPIGRLTETDADFVASILGTAARDCPDLVGEAELRALIAIDAQAQRISSSWTALLQTLIAAMALSTSGFRISHRHALLNTPLWLADGITPASYLAVLTGLDSHMVSETDATAEMIKRLERQRIEIITGEPAKTLDAEGLASLTHSARPELVEGISVLEEAGVRLADPLQRRGSGSGSGSVVAA